MAIINRRSFFRLAGLSALLATSVDQFLDGMIDTRSAEATASLATTYHPLFATTRIPNAVWSPAPTIDYEIAEDTIAAFKGEGQIDILAEMQAAVRQVLVADVEQEWISRLRSNVAMSSIFDAAYTSHPAQVFAGDTFNAFGDMIFDAATPGANAIIVGPTMLTILQAATSGSFRRNLGDKRENSALVMGTLVDRRGTRNEMLIVIFDPYSRERDAAFIGYIPENPMKRTQALVRTGIASFEVGKAPGHDDLSAWRAVGLNVDTLSFI